ncbi:hypothetical protein WUBG_01627, partial [Wuchereria bancrofti]
MSTTITWIDETSKKCVELIFTELCNAYVRAYYNGHGQQQTDHSEQETKDQKPKNTRSQPLFTPHYAILYNPS